MTTREEWGKHFKVRERKGVRLTGVPRRSTTAAAFVETDHPRHPAGSRGGTGGEFRPKGSSAAGTARSILEKLVLAGKPTEVALEAADLINRTMRFPRVPGEPDLKVVAAPARHEGNAGAFWRYTDTLKPDKITIVVDGPSPISSATHELGHYLDSLLGQDHWADPKYGESRGREVWFDYSSKDPYGTLAPVVTAIKETDMYRGLADGMQGAEFHYGGRYFRPGPRHVQYLMNPEELVARSFEQYIAAKHPGSKLAASQRHAFSHLPSTFPPEYPGYLKGDDLAHVNAAWDRVLETRGLLKVAPGTVTPKADPQAAVDYEERQRKLKLHQTS